MLAKHVLYQLSYTPFVGGSAPINTPRGLFALNDFAHAKSRARPGA